MESKISSVADQHAQDSAAGRWIADLFLHFFGHAVGHETLEPGARSIDHAQSCVLGISDAGRSLDDPLEDPVERELGVDGYTGLYQHPEAVGPFSGCHAFIVSKAR